MRATEMSRLAGGQGTRRWADALSLVVHLTALLVIADLTAVPAGLGSDPLVVDLIALPPPPQLPPVPEPQPPAAPPQEAPPPPPRPTAKPRPATATAAPPPATVPPAAVPVTTATPPPPSAEPAPEAVAVPATPTRGVGIEDYAAVVWARVMRFRPPPVRAAGTTTVRFTLSPDGTLTTAELATSSGRWDLDQTALAAVRRASPFPPPPKGETAEQLVFTVGFEFR